MKPVDVKDNAYTDSSREVSNKDPEIKVGNHVRISKCKTIFAKGYSPNWTEKFFVIKKYKNTVHVHMLLIISMAKKLLEHFMKRNYKKQTNKNLQRKKKLKEKETNYMSNGKDMIVHIIAG